VAVPDVVPADLIGRRADLVAARWRVESAVGDVAAQRAQFYPNINLSAFVGISSSGLDRLLRAGSEQYGVGPAIRLPIFDSGRLRAGLKGARRTSTRPSRHTTRRSSTSSTTSPTRSLGPFGRAPATRAGRGQDSAEQRTTWRRSANRAGLGGYLTVLNAETNVIAQRRLTTDLRAPRSTRRCSWFAPSAAATSRRPRRSRSLPRRADADAARTPQIRRMSMSLAEKSAPWPHPNPLPNRAEPVSAIAPARLHPLPRRPRLRPRPRLSRRTRRCSRSPRLVPKARSKRRFALRRSRRWPRT